MISYYCPRSCVAFRHNRCCLLFHLCFIKSSSCFLCLCVSFFICCYKFFFFLLTSQLKCYQFLFLLFLPSIPEGSVQCFKLHSTTNNFQLPCISFFSCFIQFGGSGLGCSKKTYQTNTKLNPGYQDRGMLCGLPEMFLTKEKKWHLTFQHRNTN